tara:strand:+ start:1424 stop:2410 length:987 start_codon:yes stop_codon:yes gene_type:complete
MAVFNYVGQGINSFSNADGFVVNNTNPLNFIINSGAENFIGNDPATAANESADDTITYTDYSGTTQSDVSFIVKFEGQANWANGNKPIDPDASSRIVIIEITSGPEAGRAYTLVLGPPTNEANGMFKNGNHRVGPNEDGVFCFAEGTMIATPAGEVPVESLEIGDSVATLDSGAQEIRWIGTTSVGAIGPNRPICIAANAFGPGKPHSALAVSPAHRMLIDSATANLLFDSPQLLVHAKDLVNDRTIRPAYSMQFVRYFHIMFDKHELIWANGALSESFHPSQAADNPATRQSYAELQRLFPARFTAERPEPSVRPTLTSIEARILAC